MQIELKRQATDDAVLPLRLDLSMEGISTLQYWIDPNPPFP